MDARPEVKVSMEFGTERSSVVLDLGVVGMVNALDNIGRQHRMLEVTTGNLIF
jgi:hypothetical protein